MVKLSSVRRWKRDALEFKHEISLQRGYSVAEVERLCERLARVCSDLERRLENENFAAKVKERVDSGHVRSSKEDSSLKS
jgi:hypothetical protein